MHRTALHLALLPLLLASITACTQRETPVEAGNRDQVLHLGNSSEPKDLDPHVVTGVTEHNIIVALLEGLVSEDPRTLAPHPGVASHWEISHDGRQYTFHLRPDARWSNGDPVTSEDFAFSFRRILSPGLAAPYAYMLFGLEGAEAFHKGDTDDFGTVGVATPTANTLILRLHHPIPYFLSLLNHYSWFPVHPPTIRRFGRIDELGTAWTRNENFVGNGPFALESWAANERIVVTKSETYWDRDNVRLNAIHFHAIGDHKIEENAFRAGQLHVTGTVPMERIDYYRRERPELLQITPYLGCYYYLFNVKREPLNDPRVRRALTLAIDRKQIAAHVTRGGELPAYHFTPPDTAGYTATNTIAGDIETARGLLAEAGYPDGEGMRTLQLLYNTSDAHADIAAVIQQMWQQNLGISVEMVNMEWKVYLSQTQQGEFDIARAGWIGDYNDPNTFLDMWVTDGGNNRTGWSHPEYDRLIQSAATREKRQDRYTDFQAAEGILMHQLPIMPIYFYVSKSLIQPSVQGWSPTILDHHPYKFISLSAE